MRAPVNIHDSMKMLHNNSNSKPKQLHLCAYRDKMKPYHKTVFLLKNSAEIFPRRKFIPEEFKNEESSFGSHRRVIGVGTLFRDRRLRRQRESESN